MEGKMHYVVILFIILVCLTSWAWAVFPADKREVAVLARETGATLPQDPVDDQEPLASPEYDLGSLRGLGIE